MLNFNKFLLHWKPREKLCERLFSALSQRCLFESSQDLLSPRDDEVEEKGVQWVSLQALEDILVKIDEIAD